MKNIETKRKELNVYINFMKKIIEFKELKVKTVVLIISIIFSMNSYSQQDPLYTQYMFNTLLVNPAYAGSRDVLSLTALTRFQWAGIKGAPKTQTFSADMPIRQEKMGVGVVFFNDRTGVIRNTGFSGIYSYRLRLFRGVLCMGIQASFNNLNADFSSVLYRDSYYQKVDPTFNENISKTLPNFGTGLYYADDNFYAGISIPRLVNYQINNSIKLTNTLQGLKRHNFIMLGGVFKGIPDFKIKPSMLIKIVPGAPIQLDANINAWYLDQISLGVSFRLKSAVVIMSEMQVNDQFRVGYAFDISTTKIAYYGFGSHELLLRYEFGMRPKRHMSPRFF